MPRIKRLPAEERLAQDAGPEFLEALARGLRVIQTFGQEHRQLSLSDVAKLVDLPRASVRRTLHTLIHLGFAETDGRMFRLTPRVLMLAGAYLGSNPISSILQPALERLSADINEGCSAAVLDGDDMVMIAHASPARVLQLSGQIGLRIPAVSSSLGRILLAQFDDDRLEQFLTRVQPKRLTPQTILNKDELRASDFEGAQRRLFAGRSGSGTGLPLDLRRAAPARWEGDRIAEYRGSQRARSRQHDAQSTSAEATRARGRHADPTDLRHRGYQAQPDALRRWM